MHGSDKSLDHQYYCHQVILLQKTHYKSPAVFFFFLTFTSMHPYFLIHSVFFLVLNGTNSFLFEVSDSSGVVLPQWCIRFDGLIFSMQWSPCSQPCVNARPFIPTRMTKTLIMTLRERSTTWKKLVRKKKVQHSAKLTCDFNMFYFQGSRLSCNN